MEIHIQLAGVELGPYSEKQVRAYLEEGLLSLADPARFEGEATWITVDEALNKPAAAAPAPAASEPVAPTPVAAAPPPEPPAPVERPAPVTIAPQSAITLQSTVASPPAPSMMRRSTGVTTSLIPIPKPLSKDTIRVPIPQLSKSAAQQTTLVRKAIPAEEPAAAPPVPKSSEKARTSLLTAVKILTKKSEQETGGVSGEPSAPGTPKASTTPIALPKSAESTRTLPMSVVRAITKKSDLDEKPAASAETTTVKTTPVPLPKPTSSSPSSLDPKRTSLLSAPKFLTKRPVFSSAEKPPAEPEKPAAERPIEKPAAAPISDAAFASAKLPQTLRTSPMAIVRALPKKKEPETKSPAQSTSAPPPQPPPSQIEKPKETASASLETVRFVPEPAAPLPPDAVARDTSATPEPDFSKKSLKRTTSLPSLVQALAKPGESTVLPPAPPVPPKAALPAAVPAETPAEVVPEEEPVAAKPPFFRSLGEKIGLFKSKAAEIPEESPDALEPVPATPAPLRETAAKTEKVALNPQKKPETVEKPEKLEKPEKTEKPEPEKTGKTAESQKIEYPQAPLEPDEDRPLKGLKTLPPAPSQTTKIKFAEPEPKPEGEDEPAPFVPAKPIPRWMIYSAVGAVVLLGIAGAGYFYVQASYQSAEALLKALKSGNEAQLNTLVDFPSVRKSLTDSVNAQMAKSDQGGRPAVQAMITSSINYYVTPDMISTLVNKPKDLLLTSPDQSMAPSLAAAILLKFNQLPVKEEKLVSYNQLSIDLEAALLHMTYGSSGWKLDRIDLNTNFKMPEEPGAPAAPADLGDSMFVPVIETYLADGKSQFDKKNWDVAIADFTHVLDIDPKQIIAYSNRGMARSEKADMEGKKGDANAQKSDIDGAIADFTQAISLDPKLAEAYYDRGMAKSVENDLDGAVADFTQAIQLDPKMGGAYYKRGTIRTMKGDYEGALADFTQAITLDPNNASAYSNRGYIRKAQHDLDGAIDDFTQALAINPKIVAAYYNRGLAKEAKADIDGAISDYSHALDIDPKMARAYYSRGNAKVTKNDLDGAIADYNQALNIDPKMASTMTDRALARQAKGDLKGALDDFNHALDLDPKIADAYYSRGLIKEQMGDLDGAISDSSRAVDLDPKRAQAYYNRGFAKLVKGNLEGARNDLVKFCQLAPRDPYADHARLYLWLIGMAQNPNGTANQDLMDALQNNWSLGSDDFVTRIAQFLLDRATEADLTAAAASTDAKKQAGQQCELWYFAGMKRLLAGDKATAIDYFRKCIGTDQKDYCEYILAQAELQVLAPNP